MSFSTRTSIVQLVELGDVARRPVMRTRILPARVVRFINDLRKLASLLRRLPQVDRSSDPADNFLLAMAEAGQADYLVSGDRRSVLVLQEHGTTRILRGREMLEVLKIKPP